jgi:hypothetical protein
MALRRNRGASSLGPSVLTEPLKLPREPPRKLIIGTESEDQLLEKRPDGREVLFLGRRRVDRKLR